MLPKVFVPLCTTAFIAIAIFVSERSLTAENPAGSQNVSGDNMDRSIKPGDDFYRYSNGGWIKKTAIPEGQSTYDTRAMLNGKTSQRVRDLIQNAAATHAPKGSATQKVGDYYASFMDTDSIDAKGL